MKITQDQNASFCIEFRDLLRLCPPPSLVDAYYLYPLDTGITFLHNDLLCNVTCSVTGGCIMFWGLGEHKRKRYEFRGEKLVYYL